MNPSHEPAERGGVIHIANIKGGVGKSTVATNLAACLSRCGRTLVVDLDVQGSSTYALGFEPVETGFSSYDLLARRMNRISAPFRDTNRWQGLHGFWRGLSVLLIRKDAATAQNDCTLAVAPQLDLIPASPELLRSLRSAHYKRFVENIAHLKTLYRYIVLDTPSVWNEFIQILFRTCDLNLIPVTLSALSTKSLREYLREIRKLVRSDPTVRIRIVKNEVFGQKDSTRLLGKAKTVLENRAYLASLCEMIRYSSAQSTLLLPQSIVLDLEIPEASSIRNAQDRGIPAVLEKGNANIKNSFEALSQKVREILHLLPSIPMQHRAGPWITWMKRGWALAGFAALAMIVFIARPAEESAAPAIATSVQLEKNRPKPFALTFGPGENVYKFAKYAIYRFRAVVPSAREIECYVDELMAMHNYMRLPGERTISKEMADMGGITFTFYPPTGLSNPSYDQDYPIYSYFCSMVGNQYSYVTGVWCEYGEGGGNPHKGIDVAAPVGSAVFSPVDGIAYNTKTEKGGRILGVVTEDYVIFFAHLAGSRFQNGEAVKKGEVIGQVGMSGRTSGPHVHIGYGIRYSQRTPVRFGPGFYIVTDPKQFFYRQMYCAMARKQG